MQPTSKAKPNTPWGRPSKIARVYEASPVGDDEAGDVDEDADAGWAPDGWASGDEAPAVDAYMEEEEVMTPDDEHVEDGDW